MAETDERRRVTWRRRHAHSQYVGYVTVGEDELQLAGTERVSGIYVALRIPYDAIRNIRVGRDPYEEIIGRRPVVLELADNDPIYVAPRA
jgi:hypothetical protein